jgi:pimeloyl-ACP methyl ester carboxylesterase
MISVDHSRRDEEDHAMDVPPISRATKRASWRRVVRTTFAAAALVGLPHVARAQTIVSEEFHVPTGDPGISLYLRNKHPEGMTTFRPDKTLLYVHGTSQSGEATFDLPIDGASWMDLAARDGFDVYLVDIRGFGHSSKPPEMSQPAEANPPIATTDVAVKDVGTAVDFILQRRHLPKLDLMGWSWGTVTTGAYTAGHNDKINRLVLYAPVWLAPGKPAEQRDQAQAQTSAGAGAKSPIDNAAAQAGPPPLGAYGTWTPEQARANLEKGAPPEAMAGFMAPATLAAWTTAELATDPEGAKQTPPVVRTPNGPPSDSRKYWQAGKPYYDPGAIKVPVLIVHGEWDGLLPSAMAHSYFEALKQAPSKRFVDIGGATHFMLLERNRMQLVHEVQLFLDDSSPKP